MEAGSGTARVATKVPVKVLMTEGVAIVAEKTTGIDSVSIPSKVVILTSPTEEFLPPAFK